MLNWNFKKNHHSNSDIITPWTQIANWRHPGLLLYLLNVRLIYVLHPENIPFSKITFGYIAAIEVLAFNLVVCSPSTYKSNLHWTSDIEILFL